MIRNSGFRVQKRHWGIHPNISISMTNKGRNDKQGQVITNIQRKGHTNTLIQVRHMPNIFIYYVFLDWKQRVEKTSANTDTHPTGVIGA